MASEDVIKVAVLFVLGAYFVVCSIWARDFVLYRLKARRVAGIFGEGFAHKLYLVLGVVLICGGVARLVLSL